jgi:hypothetical protein
MKGKMVTSTKQEEMAEREGFEPPIPLRVCLISSQVHSTGLCHLSDSCPTTCDPVIAS